MELDVQHQGLRLQGDFQARLPAEPLLAMSWWHAALA
jgi:hypothetical protein